jgi:hypothetical protein
MSKPEKAVRLPPPPEHRPSRPVSAAQLKNRFSSLKHKLERK